MLAGLVAAWFYVPGALAMAATLAIMLGSYAYVLTPLIGEQALPWPIRNLPLISDAAENLLFRSNGVMAALLGVLLGATMGFVFGVIWVFIGPFEESVVDGIATVFGSVAIGIAVGMLYAAYRVLFERRILQINGARRLSRREAEFILPLVAEATARLGLTNHPCVLIDDTREPNAFAYTRHIVICRGLLEEFNYDREPIAAVLAHELVHWRNGDALSAVFVRGVALPLYLLQAGGGWLRARARNSVLRFLVWVVFWPVFVTVQYFVVPMQSADSRRAEYRADEGAVLAGHRDGMRQVLNLRRSFEDGRNGWVAAVCASHPPNELRLERLEEPGKDYRLPDKDSPAMPLPVLLTNDLD
ncbi:M48 family metalloprotease [Nonomuraea sp. SYSU D8015]|uniref:M48 family metalloprotease n=1 Tax=Nonomuraea sp. SYSU D8015 TaxID=2593644 RepID=UPI001660325F|nr:M48 family metalloprotease [Nonomuraea sp. SYSU D8015]